MGPGIKKIAPVGISGRLSERSHSAQCCWPVFGNRADRRIGPKGGAVAFSATPALKKIAIIGIPASSVGVIILLHVIGSNCAHFFYPGRNPFSELLSRLPFFAGFNYWALLRTLFQVIRY